MADTETAVAPVAPVESTSLTKPAKSRAAKPAKTAVKKSKSKTPMNHPHYRDMIRDALTSLKERGGTSRQAILKYIMANFKVGTDERVVNNNIKLTLRAGVKNGTLKQSKGTGASGSFKIGEKKVSKKSKPSTEKKAVKPKKAAAPTGEKKTAKKVKKPKAAKSKPAKKVKTPKKVATKKPKSDKKTAKSPKKAKKQPEVKAE